MRYLRQKRTVSPEYIVIVTDDMEYWRRLSNKHWHIVRKSKECILKEYEEITREEAFLEMI